MLLITDRPQEGRALQRDVGLAAPCTTVGLHSPLDGLAPVDMVVSDVSLDSEVKVGLLRAALSHYRVEGAPLLCLLREDSHRAQQQARAVGATETLRADVPRDVMVRTIDKLRSRPPNGRSDRNRRAAEAATRRVGVALADILDAAARGEAIQQRSLVESTALILDAFEASDTSTWLDIVWNYDDLTYQHCLLVAGLAASFAKMLEFREIDRQRLVGGALLHDVGKARIPLSILNKPGALTGPELTVMRTHPTIGHRLLLQQGGFAPEQLAVVRHHHELLDGSGYPDGLSGEQIPDLVRLVTICDIYAALLERRPYKTIRTPTEAYDNLRSMRGKLDPALLFKFADVMRDAEPK